jgi:hypothetical protein
MRLAEGPKPKVLQLGGIPGIAWVARLTVDDKFVRYRHVYGREATVPRSAIQTVVVEPRGFGKGALKLIGGGTTLASIDLPTSWAQQAQKWLLEQLGL